ncbi:hypothetical protein POV27_17625 [Aureisphaera galaxeae]|uniref:hypothetical protein n=1 Tax=Aureisphaera galaxeae TaxID=1538023 RepID=UPI002350BCAB|nr:hypothetical protein [Aureisphaera galaxeae]MDC8005878.1 hypothetical protein [Aureisphaera galaxeae]
MKKLFLLTFAIFSIISCSTDDSDNADTTNPTTEELNSIRLRNDSNFGNVLTDADGFTLYFFAPDATGDSNCVGGCVDAWPIFFSEDLTLDSGLDPADFDSITRGDGQNQTTYKGWPLYLFASDTEANQINGDGAGGVWFVAKPDYSLMLVRNQLVGRDADGVVTNLTSQYEPGEEQTFYFTDDRGNTLYSFINDTNGVNNFTAEDFSNDGVWPIFGPQIGALPSVMDESEFAVIDVFGRTQITYRGWPLYYFGGDENRGENFGVGFPQAGIWPILNNEIEEAPQDPGDIIEQTFQVTNNGGISYVFESFAEENPNLELQRGKTYEFVINAPGHPFLIKDVQGTGTSNTYNDGVSNNGASEGVISFTVPTDAPDTLFYNCEFHGLMTGTISIID